MVFPISLIVIVLIKELMTAVKASNNMWAPPGLAFLDGGYIISMVIGVGGLMLIAKLPKLIPEFIFQIKPSPFGKAMGETVAPIAGIASRGAKKGALTGANTIGDKFSTKDHVRDATTGKMRPSEKTDTGYSGWKKAVGNFGRNLKKTTSK